ncbi:MAG: hypothetical protein LUI06_08205 [Ruminococcus sp.]|nr:hypothetical protein [Ruminococcus sp.]
MSLKKIIASAAVLAMLSLSGCSGVSFSMEELLAAPKLTDEQSQIHEALISAVGRNITLKYPKNGSNRSAYVIADVDGEPTEEAIVFYEYTGAESEGIRVNLLDRRDDGEWYSVKEIAGAGTDIDKVVISSMDTGSKLNILVGYQNPTGDNILEIYNYSDGDFDRIGSDSYSLLQTIDINSDNTDEIITIQQTTDSETGTSSTKAYLLRLSDGEIIKDDGIDMCEGVASYVQAYTGKLEDGNAAVYIDEINSDGNLQTEIIFYRYSALQNPVQLRQEKMLSQCTRPVGYSCADIDGDGVYEIPSTKAMLGYENAVNEEQILKTTWCVYEDFYNLTSKYSGYYSVSDGYMMAFPSRWNDLVTVKLDSETDEVVFYKYDGDINADMTELMRIKTTTKEESEEYIYDGYEIITSKGQIDYLVKLPTNKRETLILTIDEVQNSFYPVEY